MPTSEIPEDMPFLWIEGDAIHYDAPCYAKLRGIPVDEAIKELREILAELLPGTPIAVQD
jgi:hypothetical protein